MNADDRGQALVLAVVALGIAAVAVVGLRGAQDRILLDAQERRAGEAAVESAGAALADAELAFRLSLREDTGGPRFLPTHAELDTFMSDPLLIERVRAAANALSALNGGGEVRDVNLSVGKGSIEIGLGLGAHLHRASIGSRCCRP